MLFTLSRSTQTILSILCLHIAIRASRLTSNALLLSPSVKLYQPRNVRARESSPFLCQNGKVSFLHVPSLEKTSSQKYCTSVLMSESTEEIQSINEDTEIPMPTEAGGYTHTSASRAKISAANKGKTPWNKGKSRSEEVKKRIAEGVRRKNRERFLQKLEDLGFTEEEYELQKKEERRKKDAERRARRTENGGYRPTEETKAKISKIMKEKHARGEIKRRVYNGPFRKGFTHSEETKEKIRQSLRKKWAEVSLNVLLSSLHFIISSFSFQHIIGALLLWTGSRLSKENVEICRENKLDFSSRKDIKDA